jgi:hypothetical protein
MKRALTFNASGPGNSRDDEGSKCENAILRDLLKSVQKFSENVM